MIRKSMFRIFTVAVSGIAVTGLLSCSPAASNSAQTAVAGIVGMVQQMELRTPYPTAAELSTQTAYPSQTAYPTADGYDTRLADLAANLGKTATPYPTSTPYPTERPWSEEDTH